MQVNFFPTFCVLHNRCIFCRFVLHLNLNFISVIEIGMTHPLRRIKPLFSHVPSTDTPHSVELSPINSFTSLPEFSKQLDSATLNFRMQMLIIFQQFLSVGKCGRFIGEQKFFAVLKRLLTSFDPCIVFEE